MGDQWLEIETEIRNKFFTFAYRIFEFFSFFYFSDFFSASGEFLKFIRVS